jgi:Flp pilus assembly protein TadB
MAMEPAEQQQTTQDPLVSPRQQTAVSLLSRTAAEQPMSLAMPQPPRSFYPLALSFACAVVLVGAWRVTHVSALGSGASVAVVVTFAIWLPNRRHFQAYRREVRALGDQVRHEKNDRS